ncbi:DedA family protein [Propioniciclava sinopodophylli]|uniref:DedA family protein n=1 Tax=Propioniciclava sinopodophylli TaxID=1837344 RepID=A0A4Q9KI31_9ACTN|nr:DedA family protein [Propioniciclava sinopodophylli]TBT88447.1 DedA family protein [Propioniciclava sinopodophylli]
MTSQPAPDAPDDAGASASAEPEWWDNPALPWRHKPERADILCMSAMSIVAIYSLVMLPLRPVILGLAPHVLGSLGYRTGLVLVGALAAVGDRWWPLVLVLGSLMAIKFDWVYWWAGRLWGRNIMNVWAANKSPRTQRRWEKMWDGARRFETLAIFVTFLPVPLPAGVIYAALGAAGTKLWKFLTVGFLSALVTTAGYMALGYWIGELAVQAVDTYGRYLWYVSIAILVGMLAVFWYRQKKADAAVSTRER